MNGLLEENGKASSARVAMLVCVITACLVAVMATYAAMQPNATIDLVQISFLVGTLLGAGIGGKVIQKGKEQAKAKGNGE